MKLEKNKINELFPQFIRQDSHTLIQFLEHYYDFVNSKDKPSYVIDRIIQEHNLDEVFDEKYLNRIRYEIANNIPQSPFVQKAFLLKRIVDYYGSRGNTDSVKYFFRVFFGNEVVVYSPWENVLRPSSGIWTKKKIIKLVLFQGTAEQLIAQKIFQLNALGNLIAEAVVKDIIKKSFNGKIYFEVILRDNTISGEFNTFTEIRTKNGSCKGYLIRTFNNLILEDPGIGYKPNDLIYLKNKENISFLASIEKTSEAGRIEKLNLIDYGNSSSFNYRDDITLNQLDSGSSVYLSGIIQEDSEQNPFINDIPLILDNATDFIGNLCSIEGIFEFGRIIVKVINKMSDDDFVLHDFNYFEKNTPLNFKPLIRKECADLFIKTLNGVGAKINLSFNNMIETFGEYENHYGQPSNFSIIQDSFYYQAFSYEVTTEKQIDDWIEQFNTVVHPSGTKVFNNFVKDNPIDAKSEREISDEITPLPWKREADCTENVKVQSGLGLLLNNYFANDYVNPDPTDPDQDPNYLDNTIYAGEYRLRNEHKVQGVNSFASNIEFGPADLDLRWFQLGTGGLIPTTWAESIGKIKWEDAQS